MQLLVVPRHVHRSDHGNPCPSRRQGNLRVILKSGEAVLGVTLPIVLISHPGTETMQFVVAISFHSVGIQFCATMFQSKRHHDTPSAAP